jgi:hypothetical protein
MFDLQHFGRRVDTRTVTDPWNGLWTFTVRRAGYPAWAAWEKKSPAAESAAIMTRAMTKVMAEEQIVKPGMRQQKHRRKAARAAINDEALARTIQRAVGSLTAEQMEAMQQTEALNAAKTGLALFGLVDWTVTAGRVVMPCSIENRLRLLGYEGRWLRVADANDETGEGHQFVGPGEVATMMPNATEIVFDGGPYNPDRSAVWVDDPENYGPATFGDAVTKWLLDEAEDAEAFAQREEATAAEGLGATPSGESASAV